MWNRQFVFLSLILLGEGIVTSPIQLLFPVYVVHALGESARYAAMLRALPILLGGVFALVGGVFSDRVGRKQTLILGMTGALVVGGVFITQQPLLILGILCYQGIASGFRTAGGQSYLISSVDASRLGLATAIYFLCMTFGGAIGSAIAGELIDRFGYRVVGVGAIPLIGLLITIAILFLPSLPKSIASHHQESFAQTVKGYRKILRHRGMRLLLAIRFLPTYYWGTVSLLIPILVYRSSGVKMAAYYGTLSLLFAALCKILTGCICDAIGHRLPAFVANCLIALSAIGIALSVNSTVGLYVFGILGAGVAWSLSTTMPRFINEFCGAEEKGRGVGIKHFAWSVGLLFGQLISGTLESISVSLPFFVAAGLVVISAGLALALWLGKDVDAIPTLNADVL